MKWLGGAARRQPRAWPQVPTGEIEGGVYFPDTGYVSDPQLAACNLRSAPACARRAPEAGCSRRGGCTDYAQGGGEEERGDALRFMLGSLRRWWLAVPPSFAR
jgi:hypothetical protein